MGGLEFEFVKQYEELNWFDKLGAYTTVYGYKIGWI